MKSCIILGPPKAGNHLLMRLLDLFGMKENEKSIRWHESEAFSPSLFLSIPSRGEYMFVRHRLPISYNVELFLQSGLKGLFITRNLRALIVKFVWHIQHRSPCTGDLNNFMHSCSLSEGITRSMVGLPSPFLGQSDMISFYRSQINWRKVKNVYSTSFESFQRSTYREVTNIASHLELELPFQQLKYCAENLMVSSKDAVPKDYTQPLYFGAENWRNYFSPKHEEIFREKAKDLLESENWG